MVNGDKITQSDFSLLSLNSAKQILAKFVKNETIFKDLSSLLEDETLSGFQLRDILTSTSDFEELKNSLKEQTEFSKYFNDLSSTMGIFILA